MRLMVGRDLGDVFQRRPRRQPARVVLQVEDVHSDWHRGVSLRASAPARSSASPGSSAPAGPSWPRSSSASCPGPSGGSSSRAGQAAHPPAQATPSARASASPPRIASARGWCSIRSVAGERLAGDPAPPQPLPLRAQRRWSARVAAEFVERLRVRTPSLDQEVGKLSGGNQQKVVLARWLAARAQGPDPRRARRAASTSAPRRRSTASSTTSPTRGWASCSSPPSCPRSSGCRIASTSCRTAASPASCPARRHRGAGPRARHGRAPVGAPQAPRRPRPGQSRANAQVRSRREPGSADRHALRHEPAAATTRCRAPRRQRRRRRQPLADLRAHRLVLIVVVISLARHGGGDKFLSWQNLLNSLAQSDRHRGPPGRRRDRRHRRWRARHLGRLDRLGRPRWSRPRPSSWASGSIGFGCPRCNVQLAVIAGIVAGVLCGIVNGLIVTRPAGQPDHRHARHPGRLRRARLPHRARRQAGRRASPSRTSPGWPRVAS